MKKFFRILCVLLTFLCLIFSMTGCLKYQKITSGDFVYVPKDESRAVLYSLSEDCIDSKKEIIIIPPYIDGKEIFAIGMQIYYSSYAKITSNAMKEVYVPYTVTALVHTSGMIRGKALEKVCFASNALFEKESNYSPAFGFDKEISYGSSYSGGKDQKYYITQVAYKTIQNSFESEWLETDKIFIANTSFLFNYAGSPNDDYFFINNFGYGEKINEPPYEPTREGYSFSGWYKESECINPWDFDTDTLPEAKYNEEQEEIYQETILYAKWVKENLS